VCSSDLKAAPDPGDVLDRQQPANRQQDPDGQNQKYGTARQQYLAPDVGEGGVQQRRSARIRQRLPGGRTRTWQRLLRLRDGDVEKRGGHRPVDRRRDPMGCGLERDPAVAGEEDLDPAMRVERVDTVLAVLVIEDPL